MTAIAGDVVSARRPRRLLVVALIFIACVIAYTDRVNISVAVVAMREQFGWSQKHKGLVLSAFFYGYMLCMFAGGMLATRFGGKRVLGYCVLGWSVLTLLTPTAATASFAILIAARIGMGAAEAGTFPSAYDLLGRWAAPAERARGVAWMMNGIPIGTVIGLAASGWLIERYGWPSAFYVFALLGLIWVAIWLQGVYNDPADDPRLESAERTLLTGTAAPMEAATRLPLFKLLRWPILGIVVGHFAVTWNLYVLLTWLPSYFRDVQHLSIANAGLFSAAPWLMMFTATSVGGALSDRLIRRGARVTLMRKLMQSLGLFGSAAFLLMLPLAHSPLVALTLLCAGTGAFGLAWCGFAPAILDVAPRHSALLAGFSNTFATIPGAFGVFMIGWLIDLTGTYTAGFIVTAVIAAVGALVFDLLFEARPLVE